MDDSWSERESHKKSISPMHDVNPRMADKIVRNQLMLLMAIPHRAMCAWPGLVRSSLASCTTHCNLLWLIGVVAIAQIAIQSNHTNLFSSFSIIYRPDNGDNDDNGDNGDDDDKMEINRHKPKPTAHYRMCVVYVLQILLSVTN